jgi:hypothetical protein
LVFGFVWKTRALWARGDNLRAYGEVPNTKYQITEIMEPTRPSSPRFYRNAAILFFVIGCILAWQAVARHDWVYGAFAGITFLNALMTTLKLISLRETKQ